MDNIDKQISLYDYTFQFIQQLIPDCQNGTVVKLYPQKNYNNRKNLPLSKYGEGAFCHFAPLL